MIEYCDFQSQAKIEVGDTTLTAGSPNPALDKKPSLWTQKSSVKSYLEALEEDDTKKQKELMKTHAGLIKKQVQALARRTIGKVVGIRLSLSFFSFRGILFLRGLATRPDSD